MSTLTDGQFDDELQQALAIEPSPEFIARVRIAVGRESPRSRFRRLLVPVAALSAAIILAAGASFYLRDPLAPETIAPPRTSNRTDIQLFGEADVPVTTPAVRVARGRRLPTTPRASDLAAEVIISPADTEAFQRLVRHVHQQPLIISFEEATSQRASNDLTSFPEEGAVQ